MTRTDSQSSSILSHLQEGKSISPIEALNLFGCFRLGARIFDLKADGHDIAMEWETDGLGKKWARYSLGLPAVAAPIAPTRSPSFATDGAGQGVLL